MKPPSTWISAEIERAVVPGLVPGIHVLVPMKQKDVDGRDKPGHDEIAIYGSLKRQFRLAAGVAPGRRAGRRRRRADKTPANRGGVAGILADHDLGGAAG